MLKRRGIEGREIALAKFAGYPVGVEGWLLVAAVQEQVGLKLSKAPQAAAVRSVIEFWAGGC